AREVLLLERDGRPCRHRDAFGGAGGIDVAVGLGLEAIGAKSASVEESFGEVEPRALRQRIAAELDLLRRDERQAAIALKAKPPGLAVHRDLGDRAGSGLPRTWETVAVQRPPGTTLIEGHGDRSASPGHDAGTRHLRRPLRRDISAARHVEQASLRQQNAA